MIDENGVFSMGCDPLDGSSVIDANFSVGSIFGIWPGKGLVGRSGREQVAAAVSLYGPRTLLCIALPEQGKVFEVTLVKNRTNWEVSRSDIKIRPAGKVFAPGNLRATNDHAKYNELLQFWMKERYQLRYTGGMVPDGTLCGARATGLILRWHVAHFWLFAMITLLFLCTPQCIIFLPNRKVGKMCCPLTKTTHKQRSTLTHTHISKLCTPFPGIFTNVSSETAKAKLRLLYEVAPLGLIVETAEGVSVHEAEDKSVLDIVIEHTDHRTGVCFGGKEEVHIFKKIMF